MEDELTPEQKFAAEDPETMVPRELMQGRSPEDIVAELVRLDWSSAAAWVMVARVADDLRRFHDSPEGRQQLIKDSQKQIGVGLLLALLGASLTGYTLFAALAGASPFFIVTLGLFFGGLALAGRGWTRWRLYRRSSLPFGPTDPPAPGEAKPSAQRDPHIT